MIEHKHWKRKSKKGIDGQHIAIVGYSHYCKDIRKDFDGFTNWAVDNYIDEGKTGAAFFPRIQRYFDYEDRKEFWNRVDFFNLIPECFTKKRMFAKAESDLTLRAKARFRKILNDEKPDKVFVFSRKGWNQCPETLEEERGKSCKPLRSNPDDNWGTYSIANKQIRVCGFRHPLFANFERMQSSVQEFLKMS